MSNGRQHQRGSSDPQLRARVALRERNLAAAEACAKALAALGFQVTRTSARGVEIAARQALFEKVFREDIDINEQPRFKRQPVMPESCKVAESVYFPSKPEFFK